MAKPMLNASRRVKHGSLPSGRSRRDPLAGCFDALPAHETALVAHDLLSHDELVELSDQARGRGGTVFDLLIDMELYTADQLELCLTTHAWLARSSSQQIEHVTSEASLSRCHHEFGLHGYFIIHHVLSRDELAAIDLALHRISLAHVDSDPVRHKLYHSIGGNLLFSQQPVVDLLDHPSLLAIARSFLGEDLVAGKPYLKVDDPYAYRGMFAHTHAETHFDCLSRGLYMFLYMDSTGPLDGAFQVLPDSHTRYSRDDTGKTLFDGEPLRAQSTITNKASLTHDVGFSRRWSGYQSLSMPGNSLVALSPFLWHAVSPVLHRRRLMFLGYFDAKAMTRDFVMTSDYFGSVPYDMRNCELSLLNARQRDLLSIHLDREAWLKARDL